MRGKCLQDLPMEKQALEYVLEKARVDDVSITQEQGRKSLGALGLSGDMALARIGTPVGLLLPKAHCNNLQAL